jgi:hypothetical protein
VGFRQRLLRLLEVGARGFLMNSVELYERRLTY